MDLYIYVDESGIIPKPETIVSKNNNNFIMSVIITTEPHKLKRHFKNGIKKLIKDNDVYRQELQNNSEIKGSHITEKNKTVIFEKIFTNCGDYTEIGIIQLHNKDVDNKFKLVPARAFNFLLWKFLIRYYFKHRCSNEPIEHIYFYIDERNVAQNAKYDLKNYLEMKNFESDKPFFKSVSVNYVDSSTNSLVQFADMVANSYYRWVKFGKSGTEPKTISFINSLLVNNKIFEFPIIKNKNKI